MTDKINDPREQNNWEDSEKGNKARKRNEACFKRLHKLMHLEAKRLRTK
jgi:hypothetical protein